MSNLIDCETCGKEIAKKALVCPYCGIKRSTRGFFKTSLIVVIVFLGLALLGGLLDQDVQQNLGDMQSEPIKGIANNITPLCTDKRLQEAAVQTAHQKMNYLGQISEFTDVGQGRYDFETKKRNCYATVTVVFPTENVLSVGKLLYSVDPQIPDSVEIEFREQTRMPAGLR